MYFNSGVLIAEVKSLEWKTSIGNSFHTCQNDQQGDCQVQS